MPPKTPACQGCADRKRPCRPSRGGGACQRCSRLGEECRPVEPGLSRRQRERLKKGLPLDNPPAPGSDAGDRHSADLGAADDGRAGDGPSPGTASAGGAIPPVPAALPPVSPSTFWPPATWAPQASFSPPLATHSPQFPLAVTLPAAPPSPHWPAAPPPAPPAAPDYLLLAAVEAYWRVHNVATPLLHRGAFEAAFAAEAADPHDVSARGVVSPLYGRRPSVLLLAAAARSARLAEVALPDADRLAAARSFFAQARDLLLAGWASRTLSTLEAAQSAALLASAALPIGMKADLDPVVATLLSTTAELDREQDLCDRNRDMRRTASANGGPMMPADPWAELRRELVLRLRIFVVCADQLAAQITQEPSRLGDSGFRIPLAMPIAESIMELPLTQGLMHLVSPPRMVVDLSPFVGAYPDPAACAAAVAPVVPNILSRRCSRMGLLFVVALLLRMGERLRITAAAAGIDPTELASHPPLTSETDAESEYRLLAATSDAAVSSILSSFPEPAGTAVTSGDPAPLLVPSLGYFDTPHEACCFLSLFLGCLGAGIRSWFSAPPGSYHARNPGTPFFASPQFLAALECATVGTGIMRCLLAADPGLLYCWTSASIPALAIGGLQAAALRTCLAAGGRKSAAEFGGLEGWVEDVEVAAGFVEAMAALGVEALSPIARSFRTMIEDTKRLVVADEGPEGGAFPSFAETVLLGEAWIATVLRTRNGRTGSG